MSQTDRPRLPLRLVLALLLTWTAWSLPAAADDASETTFDRNAEREWTDVNGVKLTGTFSGVIRDEVLINAGGRVTRVRMSTLSEADIAWLWGLHNQEGNLSQLPVEYRDPPMAAEPESTVDEPPAADALPNESTTPAQPADGDGQNSDRTWTIGGNSIQGKFSGIIGTEILINVSNRVQRYRLSELSDWDRAWLWDVYNALGKLDDLPIEYRDRPVNPLPPDAPMTSDASASDPANAALYAVDATREWANPEGDPFMARFEGFRGQDYVSLHDGVRSIRWSIDNLSQADVDWIRSYHAHHGIENELPDRLRPRTPNVPGSDVADLGDVRTWTDRDGNTIQGRFTSISGEQVSIFRGHGIGWQDVHLAQLARTDLIWLQSALRAEGRLSELPLVFRDPPDEDATDSELVRERRQGGLRQWERYNGQTFVGSYQRVSEGIVQINENEAGLREEYWNDLSAEDHAYLRDRLERETPAGFFPDQRGLTPSQEEQAAGMRVWTDREGNQIVGSYSHLTARSTVVVFDTSAGEAEYIYEYLSNDDQAIIQGVTRQNQQTAQGGTSGYTSNGPGYGAPSGGHGGGYQAPYGSGVGSYQPPTGGPIGSHAPYGSQIGQDPFSTGAGSDYASTPSFDFTPQTNVPDLPEMSLPVFEWTYKCSNCGAEFDESSGLKQGDPCPKCSGNRFRLPWWAYLGLLVIPFVIRKVNR